MRTSTPPSHVTRSLCAVGAALFAATGLWLTTVRAANAQCVGDCNVDGTVAIDELILGVNIALGSQPASGCPSFQNAQRMVDIAQLIKGVNNALRSCPPVGTPTPTAMGSPPSPTVTVVTGTPTPTATQVPTVTPGGPCTGQLVGGFCWFLGALGESCDATCTGLGKTCSAGTVTYAGTGGTSAQCDAVLSALYPIFGPFEGDRACGTGGIGCAILFTEVGKPGFRCTDTPTDCAAMSFETFSRACACQ